MENTIVYSGNEGMEKKMETAIEGLGNGQENENYH